MRRLNLLFAALVAVLLAWQLLIPPALSVANDNDFQKLVGRYCLGPAPGTAPVLFDYTSLHWYFSPGACIEWPMRTLAQGAFVAAMALNRIFTSAVTFDLRWIGVVYAAIFLAGFRLLQRTLDGAGTRTAVAVQTAYVLAICNAVFVPWFNTFYFDALTLASLTGAVAGMSMVVLRERVSSALLLVAAAWLALVAGSKSQHAALGLLALPVFWLRLRRPKFPAMWARAGATAAIITAAAFSLGSVPASYRGVAPFNVLFYRILPTVPDPARYLAETRIPVSWAKYAGEHAFLPGSVIADAASQARFSQWFGPTDLIRLYARHPLLAWRVAEVNLDESSLDRVRMKTGAVEHRLGNYERSAGKKPQALSYFLFVWPALEEAVYRDRPLVYLAWIAAVVGAAWILAPRVPRMRLLLAVYTLWLVAEWGIAMLDGLDAGRHLTVFRFLLELLICADAGFLVSRHRVAKISAAAGARLP